MKPWTQAQEDGWRTKESPRWFLLRFEPMIDYQGDKLFAFTLHFNKRFYQYCHWYQLPLWWQLYQGRRHNARMAKVRAERGRNE